MAAAPASKPPISGILRRTKAKLVNERPCERADDRDAIQNLEAAHLQVRHQALARPAAVILRKGMIQPRAVRRQQQFATGLEKPVDLAKIEIEIADVFENLEAQNDIGAPSGASTRPAGEISKSWPLP